MAADTLPIVRSVLHGQRRVLIGWSIAMAAVSLMYTSFYPSMGGGQEMQALLDSMPEGFVQALGYDSIGTPAGYVQSTVYGILGPVLLLVFAISNGAKLVAGQEEDGTLELEFTAPVSRRTVLLERLAALWADVVLLVVVMTTVTWLITLPLDMEIAVGSLLAGSLPLLLLTGGFGTLALAVGAATGRRGIALGIAAGLAVVAYMLNAIGPGAQVEWMSAVSPFGWYLGGDPLLEGLDLAGVAKLAAIPVVATIGGWWAIERRDLMV